MAKLARRIHRRAEDLEIELARGTRPGVAKYVHARNRIDDEFKPRSPHG